MPSCFPYLYIVGSEYSDFALSLERHAPSTLSLRSEFYPPAVNIQPLPTTGLCGNASDDVITPQTESVQTMDPYSAQGVLCSQSIAIMIFIDVADLNSLTYVHYLVCLLNYSVTHLIYCRLIGQTVYYATIFWHEFISMGKVYTYCTLIHHPPYYFCCISTFSTCYVTLIWPELFNCNSREIQVFVFRMASKCRTDLTNANSDDWYRF